MTRKYSREFLCGLLVWATLCAASCKNQEEAVTAVTVRIAEAVPAESSTERTFPFISSPYNETVLSFRTGGRLNYFDINPGDMFSAGEEILCIDDRDSRLLYDKAKANFIKSEAEFRRVSSLYSKGNISGSAYDNSRAEMETARAAFEAAANELSYTRLSAPFNGYVQDVFAEPYQEISKGQNILSLIDLDRIKICMYIPEDLAVSLLRDKAGRNMERFRIEFSSLPSQIFNPSGINISRSTTGDNLSFLLTATVDNRDGLLFGGMSGKMSISVPGESRPEAAVPQNVLCHNPRIGNFVWKYDSETNTVDAVPVSVSTIINGMAVITSGIAPGDMVSASRLNMLSDGEKVDAIL